MVENQSRKKVKGVEEDLNILSILSIWFRQGLFKGRFNKSLMNPSQTSFAINFRANIRSVIIKRKYNKLRKY